MLIISIFLWNVLEKDRCFYLFIYFGKFDIQVTHFYFGMFTLWLSAELREAQSPVCQNQAGKLSQHRWRCIYHLGVCRWYAVRETTQGHTHTHWFVHFWFVFKSAYSSIKYMFSWQNIFLWHSNTTELAGCASWIYILYILMYLPVTVLVLAPLTTQLWFASIQIDDPMNSSLLCLSTKLD